MFHTARTVSLLSSGRFWRSDDATFANPVDSMQAIRIVLLSIASAVAYGIVHDQITARICIEYFTIGYSTFL